MTKKLRDCQRHSKVKAVNRKNMWVIWTNLLMTPTPMDNMFLKYTMISTTRRNWASKFIQISPQQKVMQKPIWIWHAALARQSQILAGAQFLSQISQKTISGQKWADEDWSLVIQTNTCITWYLTQPAGCWPVAFSLSLPCNASAMLNFRLVCTKFNTDLAVLLLMYWN